MDPLTIAALTAMVVGTGVQYNAASQAQKRQNRVIQEGLARQREYQLSAEKLAMERAREFDPTERQGEQQQIEEAIAEEFIRPVSEGQAIAAAQTTTQGDVSSDYTVAKARSDANQMRIAEQMARLLGKTTAAGRLRQNEAVRLADTNMQIGQLGNFSQGMGNATDMDSQIAGMVDPTQQMIGGLLQVGGSAGLTYAGNAAKMGSKAAGTGISATNTGGGILAGNNWLGASPGGGLGIRNIPALKL
jgi:hypothetical protein